MNNTRLAFRPQKYLLIYYTNDVLGGIETLIGRMTAFLIAEGHEVYLLTTSTRSWAQVLSPSVKCRELGSRFRDLFYPIRCDKIWQMTGFPRPDVIKTFDLPTSWCGCLLASRFGSATRLVAGIYNPYVFDHSKGGQHFMNGWKLYLRNYLKNIPNESRLACDPAIQMELKMMHGPEQLIEFWPLPIESERFRKIIRKPVWGRIVSVGRLAPMKEYNVYMIDVVKSLRSSGLDVHWDVYGDGAYRETLERLIQREDLSRHIKLHGEIDYNRFPEILSTAYVFVGMGTSILEASFGSVPNVLALAYDTAGNTYGPIYEVPFGGIGQTIDGRPPDRKVENEIRRILGLTREDYGVEAARVSRSVERYDLRDRMADFECFVANARPPKRSTLLYFMNYAYAFARAFGVHLDRWPSTAS